MFRAAYEKAQHFAVPVVQYSLTFGGNCQAGQGSAVVINDEGWIVTAAHVVSDAVALAQSDRDARTWEQQRAVIQADQSLKSKERSRALQNLGTPDKRAARRGYTSWGHNNSSLVDVRVLPEIDLAVGRLDPFKPEWIAAYPSFKDPTKNFTSGSSLCKLGFPFQEMKPTFDEATSNFNLPPEMRVMSLFPLEGIFTRVMEVQAAGAKRNYPLMYLETSSPGLRGQSGGPTFDSEGAIWAIQSQTMYLPLGFSPEIKDGGKPHKEHQFLGVGLGVHVATILGFLRELGVNHTVSNH